MHRPRLIGLVLLVLFVASIAPSFARVGGRGRSMVGYGAGGGSGESLLIIGRSGTYGIAVYTKGYTARAILIPCLTIMASGIANPTHPATLYGHGTMAGSNASVLIKVVDRGGTGSNDEWGMSYGGVSGPLCGASNVPMHHFAVGNFVTV